MRINVKKLLTLFVLTSLIVSLLLITMSGPTSATQSPKVPPMFWKANYTDYAQSGMPDFDQRQDLWIDPWGQWTWCVPAAVANSLWWMDSRYENSTTPPPTINDTFPLVSNYTAGIDDHHPNNTVPLIQHLAYLMDTQGNRTGIAHSGTWVWDMEAGIAQYLSWTGLNPQGDVNGDGIVNMTDMTIVNASFGSSVVGGVPQPGPQGQPWNMAADIWPVTTGWPNVTTADNVVNIFDMQLVAANMNSTGMFYEKTVPAPTFKFVEQEVERSEDVILILGFYAQIDGWVRINQSESGYPLYPYGSGHAVTVAGVNSTAKMIAISDPIQDNAEPPLHGTNGTGRVLPPGTPHNHPLFPPDTVHNNATFVSHDIYNVTWAPAGVPANFTLVNYTSPQFWPGLLAAVEWAVVVSPIGPPPPPPPPAAHDALAVWQHYNATVEPPFGDWDIYYSIYTDPNVWWTIGGPTTNPIVADSLPPGPAPFFPGDDKEPAVAWYLDNYAIAVWQHYEWLGDPYNVWTWNIYYSVFTPGVGWTWPAPVWQTTPDCLDPAIAIDDNGWGIVVFRHGTPAVGYSLYYSLWNGSSMSWIGMGGGFPPNVISGIWPGNLTQAWTPEICIDSQHNAITVFTDNPLGGVGTEQVLYSWVNFSAPPPPIMSWTVPAVIPGCLPGTNWQKGISPDWLGNAISVWGLPAPIPAGEPLYYAQFTSPNKTWTIPASNFTTPPTPPTDGEHPDVAFDSNNNAIAVYTQWPTGQMWYSIWNGTAWTPSAFAATAGVLMDQWPAIAFLANNKAVAVWQDYPEGPPTGEIYYSVYTPPHPGVWTPAATVNSPGLLIGNDTYVDIATPTGSPTIPPHVHDVAVTNATPHKTIVGQGFNVRINVTVANQGTVLETFNVTAYANNTAIQTLNVTNLPPGNNITITFTWNTTGWAKGNYGISANATIISGEVDTADNSYIDGIVRVNMVGDLRPAWGLVDIVDVVYVAIHYGTQKGDLNYDPNADVNCDGIIDIVDVVIVALHYGETDP